MEDKEKELIAQGWKKEMLQIHVQEYDEDFIHKSKHRMLSYDVGDCFNHEQIYNLQMWANEVNKRFPKIKIFITGTGFFKPEEQNTTIETNE